MTFELWKMIILYCPGLRPSDGLKMERIDVLQIVGCTLYGHPWPYLNITARGDLVSDARI